MDALARQLLSGSTALNITNDTATETTMTDTRHPGLITPANAPHLADLNDDSSPYPALLAIFCDDCAFEHTADYLMPADSTKAERFEIARDHLRTQLGWTCDGNGDYCPDCVKIRATAPYETKTDYPECPDCGNGCGGHESETYHVDCGENVANCACPNRPAPAGQDWRDGTTAVYRLTDWIANRPAGNETADADALDKLAADVAEVLSQLSNAETEWTIASHWRHSVEYSDPMSEERARAKLREEHEPGFQLSIASRVAGEWRHEDPKAQAHREQVMAYAAAITATKAKVTAE